MCLIRDSRFFSLILIAVFLWGWGYQNQFFLLYLLPQLYLFVTGPWSQLQNMETHHGSCPCMWIKKMEMNLWDLNWGWRAICTLGASCSSWWRRSVSKNISLCSLHSLKYPWVRHQNYKAYIKRSTFWFDYLVKKNFNLSDFVLYLELLLLHSGSII